jgi:putative oxidoreductase
VHLKNGPWAAEGGYEYNVVLIAALLALVDGGPGALSADAVVGIRKTGRAWALTALAAGAAASTLTVELGHRAAPATPSPDTTPHSASDPVTEGSRHRTGPHQGSVENEL